ncbi:MAG TPA: histidine phosphatase family protein [Acidimicrobiales bacterium]|nr:histidine phosphatase family protein [Acidimicrobiales bacterium]
MLYLVRHGRTSENAAGLLLGRLDVPLDDVGRAQAATLAEVPSLRGASRVVSSPLSRALDTARALGPAVSVDERWVEVDYGLFDGRPLSETAAVFDGWQRDLSWAPEGGESLAEMGVRVRSACEELWQEAERSDVVVVSHVSPIKAAVAWALGVGDEVCWRMFLATASVSVVGPGRSGPVLRAYNLPAGSILGA